MLLAARRGYECVASIASPGEMGGRIVGMRLPSMVLFREGPGWLAQNGRGEEQYA